MALKKVLKYTREDAGRLAREYSEISAQIKALDERKKELSALLKECASRYGARDDKGSSYLEEGGYSVGSVCRVSMSLDQARGVEYLESRGMGDLVDEVVVKTISEERLERAVSEGRLSVGDVESFTSKKVSYSVSVRAVAEAPEAEESTLAAARRR